MCKLTKWKSSLQNVRKYLQIILSDKELMSKIHKELLQVNNKKSQKTWLKWAKDFNRHLSKDDIQMANKRYEKICNIAISREIQIKTTMMCHLTPMRIVTIKKKKERENNKCSQGCVEIRTLVYYGGIVKWCNSYGRRCEVSSKNWK